VEGWVLAIRAKRTILRTSVLVLAAVILAGTASFLAGRVSASAPAPAPGSEGDPLAARSYVDQVARWQVVVLQAGQTIIGSQGTEFILRAGQAQAVATAAGGLADITAGADLTDREAVRANHLLVVPKDDGRGLRAVTQVILLVRGSYEIR